MTNKHSKGGISRAEKLTEQERKEISLKGVEAKKRKKTLPKATHVGELNIIDISLNVSVLDNGQRIISHTSVFKALGRPSRGYKNDEVFDGTDVIIPPFMDAKNLIPFVTDELVELARKVDYVASNNKILSGYDASILPALCDLYLKAREKGVVISEMQKSTAQKAEVLVRGLSRVGIVALVDEATGYQKDRARNALAEILEKFVAKELQPWVKTFPSEYYEEIFRIYGLKYPPENINSRPGFIGTLTNNVVYSRLAPNLLEELKSEASKATRKARLHQFLTNDIGHPKLREHLASIVTMLKLSDNYDDFIKKVDRVHPKFQTIDEQSADE